MSLPPSTPPPLSDLARLEHDLAEKTLLVQRVREELIRSQITVLELQDTILQKETDKADALSILGQAELVLEGKINYIFELDRVLNERIASIQAELAAARSTHATITEDLVQKLDQIHRDLGATHTLAGTYARDASLAQEKLTATLAELHQLQLEHADTKSQLAAAMDQQSKLQNNLDATAAAKGALEKDLASIHRSFAWKLIAPFRSSKRQQP